MPSITELQNQRDATALLERWLGPSAVPLTKKQLATVLKITGWDTDLAYTAFTMYPRPAWMVKIVGELKCPDHPPPSA